MSGNSKQQRRDRRFSIRFMGVFRDVFDKNLRPLIKEERMTDFEEMLKGLDGILEEARSPNKEKAPDLKGF